MNEVIWNNFCIYKKNNSVSFLYADIIRSNTPRGALSQQKDKNYRICFNIKNKNLRFPLQDLKSSHQGPGRQAHIWPSA